MILPKNDFFSLKVSISIILFKYLIGSILNLNSKEVANIMSIALR